MGKRTEIKTKSELFNILVEHVGHNIDLGYQTDINPDGEEVPELIQLDCSCGDTILCDWRDYNG